jgi:hypothetical protein
MSETTVGKDRADRSSVREAGDRGALVPGDLRRTHLVPPTGVYISLRHPLRLGDGNGQVPKRYGVRLRQPNVIRRITRPATVATAPR